MTQEDFNTLMLLLQKACDENLIHIYDSDENEYEIDWLFGDYNDRINLKVNKL